MGGCWSCVACRSHPEAEPKDEDEAGALTGHPRNPTHVAPSSGGLPNVLGDTLGKELIEEPSVPEPLPAPGMTNDILEEELIEETSMPEPFPTPCITNDLLGKVLIEDTSVPGPSILTGTPKKGASVSKPLLEPSIAYNYLQQDVELLKELQNDYVQQQLSVSRISQQFPCSLRAINLQIGHMRTWLDRTEVRLQWWEREGMFTACP
ncbi:uncharacterized protein LOC128327810 [Hemicordylus capensis]|uniref:uncharacterized protein LOC128327810 n=1 Tax=Hemicordylus capensis TaxID=884348 RepID=UPI0023030C25|nr:uncharacterized protein LOC128327810 [Hemicordylus capensis]